MRSMHWTRLVYLITLLLAGCNNSPTTWGPEVHNGFALGETGVVRFSTTACSYSDCQKERVFALGDPKLLFHPRAASAMAGEPECLPAGWTARVHDPAIATVEVTNPDPISFICAKHGPGELQVHPLTTGTTRLEILDETGTVVDTLGFSVAEPARIVVHGLYGTLEGAMGMTAGDNLPLWTSLEDAAGSDVAASRGSRTWNLRDPGTRPILSIDGPDSPLAYVSAVASGDAVLRVTTGGIAYDLQVHVRP
jgi:hypothetical protein